MEYCLSFGNVVEKDLKGRDEVRSKKFLIHFLLKRRNSEAGIYYQIIGAIKTIMGYNYTKELVDGEYLAVVKEIP